jgi:hypothetical protein
MKMTTMLQREAMTLQKTDQPLLAEACRPTLTTVLDPTADIQILGTFSQPLLTLRIKILPLRVPSINSTTIFITATCITFKETI